MLIDITRTIGLDTMTYPGDEPPVLLRTDDMSRGDNWNASHLNLSAHCGTHIDSPGHFIPDGQTIDQLPVDRFRMNAHVTDTGDAQVIHADHFSSLDIRPGDAVLFKTSNSLLPRDSYTENYAALATDAAVRLAELRIGLVGIDYLSIEGASNPDFPVHKILLSNGILILEDACLLHVDPGYYRLHCFPLKLHETEASPVRAVLDAL